MHKIIRMLSIILLNRANNASRDTNSNRITRNISSYYSTCSNDYIISDSYIGQYQSMAAYLNITSNTYLPKEINIL